MDYRSRRPRSRTQSLSFLCPPVGLALQVDPVTRRAIGGIDPLVGDHLSVVIRVGASRVPVRGNPKF